MTWPPVLSLPLPAAAAEALSKRLRRSSSIRLRSDGSRSTRPLPRTTARVATPVRSWSARAGAQTVHGVPSAQLPRQKGLRARTGEACASTAGGLSSLAARKAGGPRAVLEGTFTASQSRAAAARASTYLRMPPRSHRRTSLSPGLSGNPTRCVSRASRTASSGGTADCCTSSARGMNRQAAQSSPTLTLSWTSRSIPKAIRGRTSDR